MNMTNVIEQELLEAAHSGRDVDEIMRHHGRTKGPFYKALAKATAPIRSELSDLSHSLSEAQRNLEALRGEGDSLRAQRDRIQAQIEKAKRDVEAMRQQLAEVQPLLEQARQLQALGFTQEHLRQLHELLGRVAAGQGALPAEGIAQFFATVADYEQVTSLELAKARAQTQAEEAQAEMAVQVRPWRSKNLFSQRDHPEAHILPGSQDTPGTPHHYLHSISAGTLLVFGAFVEDRLLGVVQLSRGSTQAHKLVEGATVRNCPTRCRRLGCKRLLGGCA